MAPGHPDNMRRGESACLLLEGEKAEFPRLGREGDVPGGVLGSASGLPFWKPSPPYTMVRRQLRGSLISCALHQRRGLLHESFMPGTAPLQSEGSLVPRAEPVPGLQAPWVWRRITVPALLLPRSVSSTLSHQSPSPSGFLCPPSSLTPPPSPQQSLAHHLTPLIFIVETRSGEERGAR